MTRLQVEFEPLKDFFLVVVRHRHGEVEKRNDKPGKVYPRLISEAYRLLFIEKKASSDLVLVRETGTMNPCDRRRSNLPLQLRGGETGSYLFWR